MCESGRYGLLAQTAVVVCLHLRRRDVAERCQQTLVIEPRNPLQRRQLHRHPRDVPSAVQVLIPFGKSGRGNTDLMIDAALRQVVRCQASDGFASVASLKDQPGRRSPVRALDAGACTALRTVAVMRLIAQGAKPARQQGDVRMVRARSGCSDTPVAASRGQEKGDMVCSYW